ncbi:hypothetical protein [Dubosiella newyorkensis]|nr:hypothetical protein [Dubosiella newyorkensis]MCI9041504.1 hypothetical protein [Dubosiella newyorkensis]
MNYVSMIFYFLASAMLITFAFTNKNIFLFVGAGALVIAVLLGSLFKKKP